MKKGARNNGFDLNNRNTIFSTVPFFKDHLKLQIEAAGGTVYSNFENVPTNKYRTCFLLSPFPCLTAKFVQCLASNITVSYLLNYSHYHSNRQLDVCVQFFWKNLWFKSRYFESRIMKENKWHCYPLLSVTELLILIVVLY